MSPRALGSGRFKDCEVSSTAARSMGSGGIFFIG